MRCNYKKSIRDKENANFTSIKIVNANPSLYYADICYALERLEEKNYKFFSTAYTDFIVAEKIGVNAIQMVYDDYISEKPNYKIISELVLVMNWRCDYAENEIHNEDIKNKYLELIGKSDKYAFENTFNNIDEEMYYLDIAC